MFSERLKLTSVVQIAVAVGVMLSPARSGKQYGNVTGPSFLAFLLLAIVVYFLTVPSYGKLFSLSPEAQRETQLIREALGPLPATVLPFSLRVLFFICGATGVMAAAGYVFNEIFAYWFPNLGFFLWLLGFLCLVNFLGRSRHSRTPAGRSGG